MRVLSKPKSKLDIVDYPYDSLKSVEELFEDAESISQVIRPVRTCLHKIRSSVKKGNKLTLDDALVLVDEYFNELASVIGATVVRHEWVLIANPTRHHLGNGLLASNCKPNTTEINNMTRMYSTPLWLASIVDKIDGVPIKNNENGTNIEPQHTTITDPADLELREFNTRYKSKNGWNLPDAACTRQFLTPVAQEVFNCAKTMEDLSPILIDLDIVTQ